MILRGAPFPPLQAVTRAFKSTLEAGIAHRGPRSVVPVVFREPSWNVSEPGPTLVEKVRDSKPDLILAVGAAALDALRPLEDVPIVYVLVHSTPRWVRQRSNVTGVEMAVPPHRWLELIAGALPGRRRLGLLYDPARTGDFVRRAQAAATGAGFTLLTKEVRAPQEVPQRLAELESLVDGFWMIPDPTVVTPQSVETLLLFSLRNRVPIVTFSESYLDLGAAVAVVLDFPTLGRQAGDLARRILEGTPVDLLRPEPPAGVGVRVNRLVVQKLGMSAHVLEPKRGD
ncbi:MAG: ABC transporter substrate-binding protein [Deferrisomatales bacterium]